MSQDIQVAVKTRIYFIRHGEVKNPKQIWYGRFPFFSLTEKGRRQLEHTARELAKESIEVLYSSPLLRARQSARIVKEILNLDKINFSKKILEVKSSLQGKKFSFIDSIGSNLFANSSKGIKGETMEDLVMRMQKFISKVLKKHKGKKVAVISHGDPIMVVKVLAEKLPMENKSLRPGKEKYIQHGEVYMVEFIEEKIVKMGSIFTPNL